MKRLLVLGPNPAWQNVLFFPELRVGKINRADRKLSFASGKGINFCRAARFHNRATPQLLQFSGGETGRKLDAELERDFFSFQSIETAGNTRTCTTCRCARTGAVTELIEPGCAATAAEQQAMLDAFAAALRDCDLAAICGTLPTGTSPELYTTAAGLAAAAGRPLLVDTSVHLSGILAAGGRVTVKINAEELAVLTGNPTISAGLRTLFRNPALQYAAITAGPGDAFCCDGRKTFRYRLPRLANTVNPIGCGDTASAVWASELAAGEAPETAFAAALAAAMANCLSPRCGEFDPDRAAAFRREIVITDISGS